MNFKEHENNQYTKEKDIVERYLVRIIQRYFEIENIHSKESVEAIIIESISRFNCIFGMDTEFIKSLNGKIGKIVLSIDSIGGEPIFEKNSAFNKDFGTAANTICEGNDDRLSNNREPIQHNHVQADFNRLKETLEQWDSIGEMHVHDNKSILDMLDYVSTNIQVDLLAVEHLRAAILDYEALTVCRSDEMESLYNNKMNYILRYIEDVILVLGDAQLAVQLSVNWLEKGIKYTDETLKEYSEKIQRALLGFPENQKIDLMQQVMLNTPKTLAEGEFSILTGNSSVTTYNTGVPINSKSRIRLYLRYDNEYGTNTVLLPFTYIDNGIKVVIQGGYSSDGTIVIKNNISGSMSGHISNLKVYYQITGITEV